MYVYVVGVRIKGKSVSFAEPYVLGDKGGREVLSKFCRRAKSRTRDPTFSASPECGGYECD